ncbi:MULTISPECIES: fimbrial protein [unclassified Serratia (in: enterobacteria)]|uniref:fimbrial protein n=1 Tax=unclassified Serratia (in: enterobacteria) TaxID=2647522 RepID=UPI00068DB79A|nr:MULTISPECIES: fimbrial protein [unclassified Serratia (in: enterobacteria)]
MKRHMIPLVILTTTLLAPPLWAADGTMKFSGKLTENTCVLDAGSKNQTVALGRQSTYAGIGGSMPHGNLIIKLNNCPMSSNKAYIRFEGTQAVGTSYSIDKIFSFSNTGQPGAAGNVGFIISDGDFTNLISVNGASRAYDLNTGAGAANQLTFSVGYLNTDRVALRTPGNAVGNVQFSVVYP